MQVMVIGKGGREHAIVKSLRRSASVGRVYASPGNPGMGADAECVDFANDAELAQFCVDRAIDLVVIGPENELVLGLADRLRALDLKVFGPDASGAKLEGSKIFAKEFMQEFSVPTAFSRVVRSVTDVRAIAGEFTAPYVLKADGLCAGKGVFICKTLPELLDSAKLLFEQRVFGDAGSSALLEQFTGGDEISVFVLTNGSDYRVLPVFRDHKRLSDGDEGPNTGGMGVIGPVDLDASLMSEIESEIVGPTVRGLSKRGFNYRGVVFIGIMLTDDGPSVLEYNVRFGDPETQCLLPSIEGDLGEVFLQVASGAMPEVKFGADKIACVVLASPGYPDSPKVGAEIRGDWQSGDRMQYFLWAGVGASTAGGGLVTAGGRVAGAVGLGPTYALALKRAYSQTLLVNWPGMQFRRDIGASVL